MNSLTYLSAVFTGFINATSGSLKDIFLPIQNLISVLFPYIITLIGSLGSIWCILLGVKLAKAEEPQERDKAKGALKNAVIGFVLIFVLVATLRLAIGPLSDWVSSVTGN